jgi:hypothetical protein
VRKNPPVKIYSIQRLTTSIEATAALKEVTNLIKSVETTYQATTTDTVNIMTRLFFLFRWKIL